MPADVAATVRALGPPGRALLRTVAAAGGAVRHRLLAAAHGGPDVDRWLREALDTGLVTWDPHDGEVRLADPEVVASLLAEVLPAERAAAVERLLLAARRPPAPGAPPREQLADQAAAAGLAERSGRGPDAVHHHLAAAEIALAQDLADTARTHLERVLALGGAGVDPAEVRERLAGACARAGDSAAAAEHAGAAVAIVDPSADPVRAGRLRELLARQLWTATQAQYERAHRLADEAVALTAGDDLAHASAVCTRLWIRVGSGAPIGDDEPDRAVRLADDTGDAALRSRARRVRGIRMAHVDRIEEGLTDLREALDIARAGCDLREQMQSAQNLAWSLVWLGEYPQVVEVLAPIEARARARGMRGSEYRNLLSSHVIALVYVGRYDEARAAVATAPTDGSGRDTLNLLIAQAFLQVHTGDAAGFRATIAAARATGARGAVAVQVATLDAFGAAWAGRIDDVRGAVREVLRIARDLPDETHVVDLLAVAWRAEADHRDRSGPRAAPDEDHRRALAALRAHLPGAPNAYDRAMLAQADAEAARLVGSRTAAAAFRRAVQAWRRLPAAAFDTTYCRIRFAQCLAQSEPAQAATAATELAEALRTARDAGAEPLVALVADIARRHRIAVPDLPRGPVRDDAVDPAPELSGLTGRERDVLTRLEAGATNRAIARSLGISERTVAHHVSSILMKLDVGSRGEAAALARRAGVV